MIFMRSCRLGILAIASVDGCYLYIIIHNCILHVTWVVKVSVLIWQVSTKRSNNKISLNPAGMSNPIAVMYIPVCENRVQIESVCSVDSSSILKGMIGWYHWTCVGKFCALELRVWWLGAVAVPHFCSFQGVAICRNPVPKCLSCEG